MVIMRGHFLFRSRRLSEVNLFLDKHKVYLDFEARRYLTNAKGRPRGRMEYSGETCR